jgi:hypothetical protein
MNRDDHDPHDLKPHVERFITRAFLTRDQKIAGEEFSNFEALIFAQFDNPWQGLRTARSVKFTIDVAATLYNYLRKPPDR